MNSYWNLLKDLLATKKTRRIFATRKQAEDYCKLTRNAKYNIQRLSNGNWAVNE